MRGWIIALLAVVTGACSVGSSGHLTPLPDGGSSGITGGTSGTSGGCSLSLKIDPLTMDFGRVIVHSTVTQTLVITNTSSCPIALSPLVPEGPSASLFTVTAGSWNYTTPIPPNGAVSLQVTFSPTQPSSAEEIAQLVVDYAPGWYVDVQLSGLGVASGLCVNPTPGPISFGDVAPGQSVTKLITIEDCANESITLDAFLENSGAFVIGACPAMANCPQIPPDGGGYTLHPGEQLTYPITFTPPQPGNYAGVFVILDAFGESLNIQLNGNGVQPDAGEPDAGSVDGGAIPDAGGHSICDALDGSCFSASVALPGTITWNLETGDFNHDGIDDLIQGSGGEVVIYLQQSDGGFSPDPILVPNGGWLYATPADLNGDGWMDFVVQDEIDNVDVEINLHDGGFALTQFSLPDVGSQTRIGDFDSDGRPDLAVCGHSFGVVVLFDNGGPTSYRHPVALETPPELLDAGLTAECYSLAVGDLNADGIPDIVALMAGCPASSCAPLIVTYLANGDGSFSAATLPSSCNKDANGRMAIADLDGDGLADFVCGSSPGITIRFGIDGGQLGAEVTFDAGISSDYDVSSVVVADFDGDGLLDVAATGASTEDCLDAGLATLVFFNAGGGQFESSMLWTSWTQQRPDSIAAFRAPGASLASLAVGDACSDTISIFPHAGADGGG
jgi:hypothetical protein